MARRERWKKERTSLVMGEVLHMREVIPHREERSRNKNGREERWEE